MIHLDTVFSCGISGFRTRRHPVINRQQSVESGERKVPELALAIPSVGRIGLGPAVPLGAKGVYETIKKCFSKGE